MNDKHENIPESEVDEHVPTVQPVAPSRETKEQEQPWEVLAEPEVRAFPDAFYTDKKVNRMRSNIVDDQDCWGISGQPAVEKTKKSYIQTDRQTGHLYCRRLSLSLLSSTVKSCSHVSRVCTLHLEWS